jgi:hypothetical protein
MILLLLSQCRPFFAPRDHNLAERLAHPYMGGRARDNRPPVSAIAGAESLCAVNPRHGRKQHDRTDRGAARKRHRQRPLKALKGIQQQLQRVPVGCGRTRRPEQKDEE